MFGLYPTINIPLADDPELLVGKTIKQIIIDQSKTDVYILFTDKTILWLYTTSSGDLDGIIGMPGEDKLVSK
jgi:hypothetical protein